MDDALRQAISDLGPELNPHVYRESLRLAAARQPTEPAAGVTTRRDLAYGPHERHRLDLFGTGPAAGPGSGRPVVLYVHGGGFVSGDKVLAGTPFYDNVGAWAARCGYLGVTMNYRLAPAAPWPAGSTDVALAVDWLHSSVARYGGDPYRIVLVGQSAGAVHVAGCLAEHASAILPGVAAAVLSSCLYQEASDKPIHRAYLGEDRSRWAERSVLTGLLRSPVPALMTVSEFDEPEFQQQAAALVPVWTAATGTVPAMRRLPGHNHLTPILLLGSTADTFGPVLREFVDALSPATPTGR